MKSSTGFKVGGWTSTIRGEKTLVRPKALEKNNGEASRMKGRRQALHEQMSTKYLAEIVQTPSPSSCPIHAVREGMTGTNKGNETEGRWCEPRVVIIDAGSQRRGRRRQALVAGRQLGGKE